MNSPTERGAGVPPAITEAAKAEAGRGQDARATFEVSKVEKRQGRYLPHWTAEGAIYSTTFRLADSLPASVLDSHRLERQDILRTAAQMERSLSDDEETRLQYLFSSKIEAYLDRGAGDCWLGLDAVAGVVASALLFFDISRALRPRYVVHAWCIMPNHVHVIVQPLEGHHLSEILHSWKSFTAKACNKLLGRSGTFWQEEYYDHLIRHETDYVRAVLYTLENPAKAGLQDWKWVSGG